ncbi:hypothetical protein ACFLWY_02050 [Chloroflexota bacterium]
MASLVGLVKLSQQGMGFSLKRVVCLVTGTGLKDTDVVLKGDISLHRLSADSASIEQTLGWS